MIENSLFPQMNSTHKGFIWYVRQKKKAKCDVINRPPRSREIWHHIEECHKEASHAGRWNDWRRCWFCIIGLHYVIMQLYLPLSSCCVLSAYRWSSNVDIDRHASVGRQGKRPLETDQGITAPHYEQQYILKNNKKNQHQQQYETNSMKNDVKSMRFNTF